MSSSPGNLQLPKIAASNHRHVPLSTSSLTHPLEARGPRMVAHAWCCMQFTKGARIRRQLEVDKFGLGSQWCVNGHGAMVHATWVVSMCGESWKLRKESLAVCGGGCTKGALGRHEKGSFHRFLKLYKANAGKHIGRYCAPAWRTTHPAIVTSDRFEENLFCILTVLNAAAKMWSQTAVSNQT